MAVKVKAVYLRMLPPLAGSSSGFVVLLVSCNWKYKIVAIFYSHIVGSCFNLVQEFSAWDVEVDRSALGEALN